METGTTIGILFVVMATLTFEALVFGEELAEESFPDFEEPDGLLDALIGIVESIWGAVTFLFNLLTFNVPGAPWFIRVPVAVVLCGGLFLSIAQLIRGN